MDGVRKNILDTDIKLEKETGMVEEWREGKRRKEGRQVDTCLTSFLQPSSIV